MCHSQQFDFANILFSGPCNQQCPYCIGHRLPARLRHDSLSTFPPRNLDGLIALLHKHTVRQLILSGVNTDPQLYRYEARLLRLLRDQLPDIRLSLHTNGQLAIPKIGTLNTYDSVTVSLPSFEEATFRLMTGTSSMPDLSAIVRCAQIPVKVSCVVCAPNAPEIPRLIGRCRDVGVTRVALRQLYGDRTDWGLLADHTPVGSYRGNPVYQFGGVEVTYWRFQSTTATSINLFSDGTISTEYLLCRAE